MSTLPTIERDELSSHIDEMQVVETLPLMYFRKAHLPGAVNIPPEEVDELAPRLLPHRDDTVIVYCFDEDCPYAAAVGTRLIELGYSDVREYTGGKQDWIDAGLPTERGAPPAPARGATSHEYDSWKVDTASEHSFPASDPPGHSPLRADRH
jgi:3-mercaptopyruvate sulfurtransferase SseA